MTSENSTGVREVTVNLDERPSRADVNMRVGDVAAIVEDRSGSQIKVDLVESGVGGGVVSLSAAAVTFEADRSDGPPANAVIELPSLDLGELSARLSPMVTFGDRQELERQLADFVARAENGSDDTEDLTLNVRPTSSSARIDIGVRFQRGPDVAYATVFVTWP